MTELKVSIITVCYNAASTIGKTVQSVLEQDYPNIEYIVVDGASSDETMEIVRSFPGSESFVVKSEKDHGLYDALNKGLILATGDIIGILHADDHLSEPGAVSGIVSLFIENELPDAVSTSVEIFKPDDPVKPYRFYNALKFRNWQMRLGIQPPHPGFYIRKSALNKVGLYSTDYKISGDFDWLLRAIRLHKIRVIYSSYVSVHMLDGGLSSSGWESKKRMNRENLAILKQHNIKSNLFIIYLKYLFKVFQMLIK